MRQLRRRARFSGGSDDTGFAAPTWLWVVLAIALCGTAYVVIFSIPDARMRYEKEKAQDIAAESSAFCERFGMPGGSRQHDRCIEALKEVRERQDQRHANEMRHIF